MWRQHFSEPKKFSGRVMTNGPGVKKPQVFEYTKDPKFIFKTLKSIAWIYGEPILRYKLRELAFRWVAASNLVLGESGEDLE